MISVYIHIIISISVIYMTHSQFFGGCPGNWNRRKESSN